MSERRTAAVKRDEEWRKTCDTWRLRAEKAEATLSNAQHALITEGVARDKAEAEVKALREELAALLSVLRQCVRAMDDAAESLRAGKVTSPAPLLTTIREVKINDEDFPTFLESKEEA